MTDNYDYPSIEELVHNLATHEYPPGSIIPDPNQMSAEHLEVGNPVDAAASDSSVVEYNLKTMRAGDNLSWTVNDEGDVTLDATDTNTDTKGMTTDDKQAMTTHPVPISEIPDADYVDVPVRVPQGKTLNVWKWGARTDSQTTPAGLTVGLYDYDAAAYVTSTNTAYKTGTPLASADGAGDLALRLENATGGKLNAGADFSVTIE
jgi:hypothetical protein